MSDEEFIPFEPAEPATVRRGPGRPRKVDATPVAVTDSGGVRVRTLKDIQMPREYLQDYFEGQDPKLRKGDLITMRSDWAALLIAAGKVETA